MSVLIITLKVLSGLDPNDMKDLLTIYVPEVPSDGSCPE